MSKEEKLSEKFMIFVGKCNGACLTKFDITKFNDEARIIANGIDKFEKQHAELKAEIELYQSEVERLEDWRVRQDIQVANKLQDIRELKKQLKENEELKAEYERCKQMLVNQQGQIITLQQQLKEKDEEIAKVKANHKMLAGLYHETREYYEKQLKTNTKQVCEKIKETIKQIKFNKIPEKTQQAIKFSVCYEINQIEKGEN